MTGGFPVPMQQFPPPCVALQLLSISYLGCQVNSPSPQTPILHKRRSKPERKQFGCLALFRSLSPEFPNASFQNSEMRSSLQHSRNYVCLGITVSFSPVILAAQLSPIHSAAPFLPKPSPHRSCTTSSRAEICCCSP